MNSVRLFFVLLVVAALLGTAYTARVVASPPSQVEPPAASGGVNFPAQAPLFVSLGNLSEAIMANVTKAQWTNASANYADYTNLTRDITSLAGTNVNETGVVQAIQASDADLGLIIAEAQNYYALNTSEQPLLNTSPHGTASQNNVLGMAALASGIQQRSNNLAIQYSTISAFVAPYALDNSSYSETTNDSHAYATTLGNSFSSVSARVFNDTNTTLDPVPAKVKYGDTLNVTGVVSSNHTAVSNGTVDILIDGNLTAQANTNASGFYAASFALDNLAQGKHAVVAEFTPTNVPLNPSSSPVQNLTMGTSAVQNNLSIVAQSPLFNRVSFSGTLTTDGGAPVRNATVLLYVDNVSYTATHTNANGSYSASYSQDIPSFVRSLVAPPQSHAYTVFDSAGQPLEAAQSNVMTVSSGSSVAYVIGGILVMIALLATYIAYEWQTRRASGVPAPLAEPMTSLAADEQGMQPILTRSPAIDSIKDIEAGVVRAKELCRDGQNDRAICALYGAVVLALSTACGITLTPALTTREIFFRIISAVPEQRAPLRTLTCLYELANYGDRSTPQAHVLNAIECALYTKTLIEAGGAEAP